MEKMNFLVRKAVVEDVEEIRILARDSYRMYTENAGITEMVTSLNESYEDVKMEVQTKEVFVAIFNEKVIGSLRVEIKPDKTAYLSKFGISVLYQNNGVGKMLMSAVDDSMKMLGIDCIYLHTASRMFSLVKFYYEGGYYIESTTKDRGYIRALLCKEYKTEQVENALYTDYESLSAVL